MRTYSFFHSSRVLKRLPSPTSVASSARQASFASLGRLFQPLTLPSPPSLPREERLLVSVLLGRFSPPSPNCSSQSVWQCSRNSTGVNLSSSPASFSSSRRSSAMRLNCFVRLRSVPNQSFSCCQDFRSGSRSPLPPLPLFGSSASLPFPLLGSSFSFLRFSSSSSNRRFSDCASPI